MKRSERRAAAKKSLNNLNARAKDEFAAAYHRVLDQIRGGNYLDAQILCRRALERNPDHPEILHLMALVCFNAKQLDHAVEWASLAVKKEPKANYFTTLGTILLNLGRQEDAVKAFEKAVQIRPNDAGLWSNLGLALIEAGRGSEAVVRFQRAIEIDPRQWDAAFKAGVLLHQQNRLEEALVYLERCNELRPGESTTLHMRALVLHGLKRFEEAAIDNRRAHELDPNNPQISNSLGYDLTQLGRHEEALRWFDLALGILPNFVQALNNKAFSLSGLHRFDEAFACYARVKEVDPDNAIADWNLGLLHMLTGNFEAGWLGREARRKDPSLQAVLPKFHQPMWLGKEAIDGATLLIHADEGLGDAIQFVRYIPMVVERGAQVILIVQDELCPLLAGTAGVATCLPKSVGALPSFDLYCPLSSLPHACGTRLETIPAWKSYLPRAPADRVRVWQDRLGPRDTLRVGLVWSGNPKHANDRNRSIGLQTLSGILDLDATFISLQKDVRPDDKVTLLARNDVVDLTTHLTDFAETAALISCLDLVIAVDTSVAHLSAALGQPTWILLPYMPDYRWLLDREDSPWYPTVRLFRQTATREYASVLDRVRTELRAMISAKQVSA